MACPTFPNLKIRMMALTCEENFTDELTDHVNKMSFQGWAAKNKENGLNMFACPSDDPFSCFDIKKDDKAVFQTADQLGVKTKLPGNTYVLHEFPKETNYWIRSSADGRFVGFGGNPSMIVDSL